MSGIRVGEAAARTGWSPRMLRYLERAGLVRPARSPAGYRLYGIGELNRLRSLRELRRRFAVELTDLAFAVQVAQGDFAFGGRLDMGWTAGYLLITLAALLPSDISDEPSARPAVSDPRGVILVFVVILAAGVVQVVWGDQFQGPTALLWLGLVWTWAAFGEEIGYRGYLLTRAADLGGRSRAAYWAGVLVVSILFGYGHYYKGMAGVMGYAAVSDLAHDMEALLAGARASSELLRTGAGRLTAAFR